MKDRQTDTQTHKVTERERGKDRQTETERGEKKEMGEKELEKRGRKTERERLRERESVRQRETYIERGFLCIVRHARVNYVETQLSRAINNFSPAWLLAEENPDSLRRVFKFLYLFHPFQ